MTLPPGQICENCVFFAPTAEVSSGGRCHQQPPIGMQGWPTVARTDWCGQWRNSPPIGEMKPAIEHKNKGIGKTRVETNRE